VAMDDNGNAIAVWSQSDGTRNNIWANRYKYKGGWQWGKAQLIETNNIGDAQFPQVAINPSTGDAVAVWQQMDYTRLNIWANLFN
jgi:hypothetical protein